MKKKLFLLFGIFILMIIPKNVYATTQNISLPINSATNYYLISPNPDPGGKERYLDVNADIVAIDPYSKHFLLNSSYQTQNKDISFTDIFSSISATTFTEMCGENGCNATFSIEIGASIYCGTVAATDYCGLHQQTILPLNGPDFTIATNYGFASYLMQHLEVVYKDFNGRVKTIPLITSDIITLSVYQAAMGTGRHIFTASTDERDFAEFLGIRVNYDASLLNWVPPSASHNLLDFVMNNNIAANVSDSDVGVLPPMPEPDKSEDPYWYLFNDTYNPAKQNQTLNNIQNKLASNSVISSLILLPVNLWQKIYNVSTDNTCSPINLGSLYGTNISLPCIRVSDYIGSTLWNTIDIICTALFLLVIRKRFVDIFNDMTMLKDRGNIVE